MIMACLISGLHCVTVGLAGPRINLDGGQLGGIQTFAINIILNWSFKTALENQTQK